MQIKAPNQSVDALGVIAIYPRRRSKRDPFLGNLSNSAIEAGWRVRNWIFAGLIGARATLLVLNWPENLWSDSAGGGVQVRFLALKRTTFLWIVRRARSRGTVVVLIAHNAYPHGSVEQDSFWSTSAKELVGELDGVCHFHEPSSQYFSKLMPDLVHRKTQGFPIASVSAELGELPLSSGPRTLLILGANQRRKNLQSFLSRDFAVPDTTILVSGFSSRAECARRLGCPESWLNPAIFWLGHRVPDTLLGEIFARGTVVLLNQSGQLNSGVLWLAVANGVPVIAPRSEVHRHIQDEVGRYQLRLFTPPLTPKTLTELLARGHTVLTPNLELDHSFSSLVDTLTSFASSSIKSN